MKEILKVVWRYIIAPIVETIVTLSILFLFAYLTISQSKWFGVVVAIIVLGLAVTSSLCRMYIDDENENV